MSADYNSIEQIKAQGIGERVQRLKNNEYTGSKRMLLATIVTAAGGFGVNSIGDRLFLGILPRFSRVTSVKISTGAMGTSATISIGTDAVAATAAITQKDYGTGTGTELVSGLSVASATTTPVEAINQSSTVDATGLPVTTSNDKTRINLGLGFENQTGQVGLYATTAGATYSNASKVLVIIVEYVDQSSG